MHGKPSNEAVLVCLLKLQHVVIRVSGAWCCAKNRGCELPRRTKRYWVYVRYEEKLDASCKVRLFYSLITPDALDKRKKGQAALRINPRATSARMRSRSRFPLVPKLPAVSRVRFCLIVKELVEKVA